MNDLHDSDNSDDDDVDDDDVGDDDDDEVVCIKQTSFAQSTMKLKHEKNSFSIKSLLVIFTMWVDFVRSVRDLKNAVQDGKIINNHHCNHHH